MSKRNAANTGKIHALTRIHECAYHQLELLDYQPELPDRIKNCQTSALFGESGAACTILMAYAKLDGLSANGKEQAPGS